MLVLWLYMNQQWYNPWFHSKSTITYPTPKCNYRNLFMKVDFLQFAFSLYQLDRLSQAQERISIWENVARFHWVNCISGLLGYYCCGVVISPGRPGGKLGPPSRALEKIMPGWLHVAHATSLESHPSRLCGRPPTRFTKY